MQSGIASASSRFSPPAGTGGCGRVQIVHKACPFLICAKQLPRCFSASPLPGSRLHRNRSLPTLPSPRRRVGATRLAPFMSASSSFDQPEQEVTSSQTMGIQPLRLLLVPALVIALLSKVIDGKGILLASYWAVRYLLPATGSLWAAKCACKWYGMRSAASVLAMGYAGSMAASHHVWSGPTSTIKMHYPLFDGTVAVPTMVAKWIRHNRNMTKLLTKTLAWGPLVLLTMAAALQLAVWLDQKARQHTQLGQAAKTQSQQGTVDGQDTRSTSSRLCLACAIDARLSALHPVQADSSSLRLPPAEEAEGERHSSKGPQVHQLPPRLQRDVLNDQNDEEDHEQEDNIQQDAVEAEQEQDDEEGRELGEEEDQETEGHKWRPFRVQSALETFKSLVRDPYRDEKWNELVRDPCRDEKWNEPEAMEAHERNDEQMDRQDQEGKLETIQLKLEAALGIHQQLNESIAQMQAEMKAICTKHEADVAALTAEHDDIEVMLREELTDMECRHQSGLKALMAAHGQQLTDLHSGHRQVDHLQGENENLEAVVKRLQDELRELEASHEDERQQLQRSHNGLSNAELKQAVEIKRLEEVQQEELEELRKQVQPAIEQRDNAIAQQAELQAAVAGLERQVALIHQEHEGELEVVCDSHDEIIDKLQDEHTVQLCKRDNKHAAAFKRVSQQNGLISAELKQQQEEADMLREQLEQWQIKLSCAQKSHNTLYSDLLQMKSAAEMHFKSRLSEAAKQQIQLQEQTEKCSSQDYSVLGQLESSPQQQDQLMDKQQQLKSPNSDLESEHGAEVSDMHTEFAVKQTQLLSHVVKVTKEMKQELSKAHAENKQLHTELSRQQRSSQTSLEALGIEHKCTRDDLQDEVQRLQALVGSSSESTARDKILYDTSLEQLDSALTEVRETRDKLSAVEAAAEDERLLAQATLREVEADNHVLQSRLTEAAQSHGKLKEQYWELWEKHDLVYNHAEGLLPEHELLNLLAKQEEGADEAATQAVPTQEASQEERLSELAEEVAAEWDYDASQAHGETERWMEVAKGSAAEWDYQLQSDGADLYPKTTLEQVSGTAEAGPNGSQAVAEKPDQATNAESALDAESDMHGVVTAPVTGDAKEAEHAAAGKAPNGSAFEVEVWIESSNDKDHRDVDSGDVKVNVHSGGDSKPPPTSASAVTIPVLNGGHDSDDNENGDVQVAIHPAWRGSKPSQATEAAVNIAESSGGDDDGDDGTVEVMVHMSLFG